jgi:hypothetical protein
MVQYPCSICGKQYKRLGNLRRHRLVCELLCRSVDVQENEQEDVSDCPSRFEMWKIIKIQAVQLEKLQKELHSLKQSGLRVQRKIKVLEWLNQKAKPKLSYSKWIETFTLTNKHLHMIFDTNFIKGFINILQSIILIDNVDTSPLCAFCHKNNILYYFDGEKWSVMQFSIFKTLINTLYQELLVYFSVWYKQNQNKFESLDSSPKWQENLRKFMGSGKERDESIQYIKKGFYKNLKIPFSSVC